MALKQLFLSVLFIQRFFNLTENRVVNVKNSRLIMHAEMQI